MKTIYCVSCAVKVGELAVGSLLKKNMVFLCENCEIKRKMSDLAKKTKSNPVEDNPFSDIFGGTFGGTFGKK